MADMVQLGDDLTHVSTLAPSTQTSSNAVFTFDTDTSSASGTALTNYVLTFQFIDKMPVTNSDAWIRVLNNTTDGLGVRGTENNQIFINKGATNGTNQCDGSLTADITSTFALTVSASNNVAYLSNLSTGQYITLSQDLTTLYTNATSYTLTSGASRVFTNGGNQHLAFGQVVDLSGLTAAQVLNVAKTGSSVPEPATGSLSLLALAGLAARRRRK